MRFTIRRGMIAIAAAGIGMGLLARHLQFREIAARHAYEVNQLDGEGRIDILPWPAKSTSVWIHGPRHAWHELMQTKYERAARFPWLPVAPDMPEPK